MSKKFTTKNLCIMAILIAAEIVLARFGSIESGAFKISLGFVPIAVCAMTLGPFMAGIMAVIADCLGMLIFSRGNVFFFPFTVSQFLYGVGFGLMLYNKKPHPIKLSLYVIIQYILINVVLGTFWNYLYAIVVLGNAKSFYALLISRLGALPINLPMQIIVVNLILKYLKAPIIKTLK